MKIHDLAALRGLTITSISVNDGRDEIRITTSDGRKWLAYHRQDCCESVNIHDIRGDLQALVGSPLVIAAESSVSGEWPEDVKAPEYGESYTWTTYHLATDTASVRIRWLGESNGYYSESVDLEEIA